MVDQFPDLKQRLWLGCWQASGWSRSSNQNFLETVAFAFEHGITRFDTAESYGKGAAEMLLGRVPGLERSSITIASKFSHTHSRPQSIENALMRSFKRLKTDYLDIYYQHWPPSHIPLDETISFLVRLKKEGKIRQIGVSNWGIRELRECSLVEHIEYIQIPYNLFWRAGEALLFPFCRENGISPVVYSPFCQGLIFGRPEVNSPLDPRLKNRFYTEETEYCQPVIAAVQQIAERADCTPAGVCLNWIVHKIPEASIITGCSSTSQLNDIVSSKAPVSDSDFKILDELSVPFIRNELQYESIWGWHSRS